MAAVFHLLDWPGLSLQPRHGKGIVSEVALSLLQDLRVVVIDPCFLLFSQKTCVDEILAVWHHGNMLKSKEGLIAKGVLGLNFLDHDDVLNPDAIAVFHIISWFIGYDVSWGK